MSSESVQQTLRRLKPGKHTKHLHPRVPAELPYIGQLQKIPDLLLDTTVYIDEFRGRLSSAVELSLRAAPLSHSTVTESELMTLIGLLDPAHPGTDKAVKDVITSVERRPSHRVINPDIKVWREAGILAGVLARLQQYGKAERRRALNDALIFISAANAGLTVLTRNIVDFDLLLQLAPRGKVLFYDLAQ